MICGESKAGNEEGLRLSPGCPETGLQTAACTAPSGQSSPALPCKPKGRRKPLPTRYHPEERQPHKGLWRRSPGTISLIYTRRWCQLMRSRQQRELKRCPRAARLSRFRLLWKLQPRCPQIPKDTAQREAGSKPRPRRSTCPLSLLSLRPS